MKKIWKVLCLILLSAAILLGCQPAESEEYLDLLLNTVLDDGQSNDEWYEDESGNESNENDETTINPETLDEDGTYTSKEEVAAYLNQYQHLPSNFITKKEAQNLGWVNTEGNLGEVAPGKSIGGDYFGNREGLLPKKDGRKYYECDIDTDGTYRGGKRIVYSNDGLIYYTEDHYETFELLYGEE